MVFYFSVTILILALGAQLTLRSFGKGVIANNANLSKYTNKIFRYFFYGAIILIFANSFYLSYSQYKIWKYGPFAEFTKFFLPPHQNINYFIGHSLFNFFAAYLASFAFALLFLKAAKYYNKKFEEKFFYPEEYYLGALAIFLSGFPGIFLYIISLFLASILGSLILNRFSIIKGERISFYYLWIPVAIFVIITSKYLQQLPIWQLFKL